MKLDNLCNQIYVVAMNEAKLKNHEYVTPEHFIYAALMFDIGKNIIQKSGGDCKTINDELKEYFDATFKNRSQKNPIDSYDFIKMLDIASSQAALSGKDIIYVGDVIAAIFSLKESNAAYILNKNGVTKYSLLKIISHEMNPRYNIEQKESSLEKRADANILDKYTINMTNMAKKNIYDEFVGREDILKRTIQVLSRRIKNNPIHVGDPGVGKTTIVEGLAKKIIKGEIPNSIKGSQIFYLDLAFVIAGTKHRGDFEERLFKILNEIALTKKPIIYIDEIHTVVGAGAISGGSMDASNIIKPFLIKRDLKFIGSTTFEEYKKYFDKDKALSRRFQRIDVNEPTILECINIINGIKSKYEEYHNVLYTDEIIKLTCELSGKYINDRFLPDKAIDVIDETGAYIRMNSKDNNTIIVTKDDIEKVIASMTKLPQNTISNNEINKLLSLNKNIKKQIFGQDEAIDTVVNAIKSSRAGIGEYYKPIASLLFVGATGVGKTEISIQLAKNLGIKLHRFDMSEYQEKHSVSRLIGPPPGYVGYEEGGILTELIRKNPYCVLLLDEIEKAHPNIYNILLQIMDYGSLTDNFGKKADFKNVILIMTSNAGADKMNTRIVGFDNKKMNEQAINKELSKIFNTEFRNRLDSIVIFKNINSEIAYLIAAKALNNLSIKLKDKNIIFKPSKKVIEYISLKGHNDEYGAREIIRLVDKEIKKVLVDEILFGKLVNGGKVNVKVKKDKLQIECSSY